MFAPHDRPSPAAARSFDVEILEQTDIKSKTDKNKKLTMMMEAIPASVDNLIVGFICTFQRQGCSSHQDGEHWSTTKSPERKNLRKKSRKVKASGKT